MIGTDVELSYKEIIFVVYLIDLQIDGLYLFFTDTIK